jgi:2-keto-4-pentenoate hydratase/2-oxohepta-3-ene-1,7-dioic acid hydratase in catechol pathway
MRLIRYLLNDNIFAGRVQGTDTVVPLTSGISSGATSQASDPLKDLIRNGFTDQVETGVREATIPITSVKILSPIETPSKIIAIGLNYLDHCIEQKIEPPKSPLMFAKYPSSIINPEDYITWDPSLTTEVDYEAELAVVIGKKGRKIKSEDAFEYIFGYTALNDVSARDLQFSDGQWIRGKSLDTFCPMGPCIVTSDEITEPNKLAIQCRVNGELLQDSNTSKMVFNIPYLIEYISQGITLYPGDIIATGTPHGVGVFREPKVLLKHGDTVEVIIEGVGTLRNRVNLANI